MSENETSIGSQIRLNRNNENVSPSKVYTNLGKSVMDWGHVHWRHDSVKVEADM